MAQKEATFVRPNNWYLFVTDRETFKGRVTSIGGVTAKVIDAATGTEKVVDVSAARIFADLTHDGPLEVRFLWSRWTLEVEIKGGKVMGSITGQSAKTVPYQFDCGDEVFIACLGHVPEAPETAELALLSMMRKWAKLVPYKMTPKEAWLYAAEWGTTETPGGSCMYGFSEDCRVQSEDHRTACLKWIDTECIPDVIATPANFDADELNKLQALRRYLAQADVAPESRERMSSFRNGGSNLDAADDAKVYIIRTLARATGKELTRGTATMTFKTAHDFCQELDKESPHLRHLPALPSTPVGPQ